MSDTSFTRKRGRPFRFSEAERARLDALTDAEIETAAEADPDNPPVDAGRLNRMALAREVRRIRERTGLSQPTFAARWRIGLGRLRDWEQARSEPDFPVLAYLRLIADFPEVAEQVVETLEREGATAA